MSDTRLFRSTLQIKNGTEVVKGEAEGEMHLPTGEVLVTHRYAKEPKTFNLGFMPIAALTGIPEPERVIGKAVNPFRDSLRFSFERKVRISGQRAGMTVRGGYEHDGQGGRKGFLEVDGATPTMSKIVSIEPTVETWLVGKARGEIRGCFEMRFVTADGENFTASTSTVYKIVDSPKIDEFKVPHFRFITIQAQHDGRVFRQEEQISLFQCPTEHVPRIKKLTRILR